MRTPLISPFRRVSPASVSTAPLQPGDNVRGASLMCMSMVAFTCNDTVMKFVVQEMPLYQAMTLRGLVVLLALYLIALREGGLQLRLEQPARFPMILRLIGEVGSTFLFLNALQNMAIADLSVIMQSLPLVVMAGAALVFGERLGWRRIGAVAVGVVGVLIVLRPGSSGFHYWSVMALLSVALITLRDLITRKFGASVKSTTIAFYASVAVTVFGALASVGQGWIMPSKSELILLLMAGAFLSIGYMSAVSAMRVGEIIYVAPFRYVSLVVAIIAGAVVFGEWPDLWTWIGATLIVAAGIYSIWREAQLRS